VHFTLSNRWLLAALLCGSLFAQGKGDGADPKKLRQEADAAVQAGDYAAASVSFKALTEANPKDAQAWHMLGYSLHITGKLVDALKAHLKAAEFPATAPIASYNVACVHALKGRTDDAFTWLDKAVAAGFGDADQLRGDSDLESLRKDPRFAKAAAAMANAPKAPARAFAQNIERRSARLAWFDRKGSPGQVAIDYTPVGWQADYDSALAAGKFRGKKWRLGSDFWTRLDSSLDLQFGDVSVPAGYYYLTLVQRDADSFVLGFHDAAAVRKQKLDAFQAEQMPAGIEVVVSHSTVADVQKQLEISVATEPGSQDKCVLGIAFGGHRLSAPFAVRMQ